MKRRWPLEWKLALGIAALLFVWLPLATEWVVRLVAREGDFVIRAALVPARLPTTDHAIDRLEVSPDTRLEMVTVVGWALPPAAWRLPDAPLTECDLLFKGEAGWYRVGTAAVERRDVRDILGVPGQQVLAGFQVRFSPVAMAPGAYRLAVVIREGANDIAMVWTDKTFVQSRAGFREHE